MATTQERLQILKMIEEGTISASEGADLLRALDKGKAAGPKTPLKGTSPARWLRVRVSDLTTGNNKVNVNIPIGLVNIGMKMGLQFAPDLEGGHYDMLMEAIRSGEQGRIIDITDEDGSEHIEIFVE
jgi:hypothetical protein